MDSVARIEEGRANQPLLVLYLIRHGQAETNLTGAIGRCNSAPLTPKGEEQARKLGAYWKHMSMNFDYVFSSIAVRASQTALIATQVAGISCGVVQKEEIVEIGRGICEGIPASKVFHGQTKAQYEQDPYNFRFPEGESERDVEERMYDFVENTIFPLFEGYYKSFAEKQKESESDDQKPKKPVLRVAVVSHGCAIRCLVRRLLGADTKVTRFELGNTSVCELHYLLPSLDENEQEGLINRGHWAVRSINGTHHLH
jgi:broad specificity phosphatase PhoE